MQGGKHWDPDKYETGDDDESKYLEENPEESEETKSDVCTFSSEHEQYVLIHEQ